MILHDVCMSEAAAIMGREGARSLGAQFAAAREKRGLSIEKVSSETHIRVQRLREIERDDFSHFSHPSYARMYAIDYAKYLGIPISRFRRLLPDARRLRRGGLPISSGDRLRLYANGRSLVRRRRRLLPKLAAAALLVLFSFGGFKLWITFRDIERLGLNRMASGKQTADLLVPQECPFPRRSVTPRAPVRFDWSEAGRRLKLRPETPVGRSVPSDTESSASWWVPIWTSSDRIR